MKLHMLLASPYLAVFALATPAVAAQNDEAALKSLEERWVSASMHHDRDTLNALLDDSYREFTPAGVGRTKSDVLKAPPAPAGSRQKLEDLQVSVQGDRAIVSGENHFMAPNGQEAVFAFENGYQRRDGIWRAVASWIARK
jgi:hypothetical protein